MKEIIRLFFFILLIITFSCEKGLFVKCSDCLSEEPVNTQLIIKVNPNPGPTAYLMTLSLYEGNIEDNILITSYSAFWEDVSPTVSLNKKYTAAATYLDGDKKYIAIDSAIPRVRYEKSQCENPCYYVYDRTIDVRLKYTK